MNRCSKCESEYPLDVHPACPSRDVSESELGSVSPEQGEAPRPSISVISMATPVSTKKANHLRSAGNLSDHEQSFATTSDVDGFFLVADSDSTMVLGTGATANLVCFCWLRPRNRILQRRGSQKVSTYPSSARFRFGNGRLGEVRRPADISAGIPVRKGEITVFVLDADIPTLLRKGALEVLEGQPDYTRGISTLRKQRVGIFPKEINMGRLILSVVDFGADPPRYGGRPEVSASFVGRPFTNKRPNLPDGGMRVPRAEDGSDERGRDGCVPVGPKEITMKLHVNQGNTSAQQLIRVLRDSNMGNMHLIAYINEVLTQRAAFRSLPRFVLGGGI